MTTSSHPVPRIFVSHSSKDNAFGVQLVEDLRRTLGDETAVWYDAKGLHGGDSWWRTIVTELVTRNVFIVVLSPDAVESPWVNDEIDLAWRMKNSPARMRIIPVLHRESKARDELYNLQIVSFLPPKTYESAFNDLLIALGLPPNFEPLQPVSEPADPTTIMVRQILPQIEAAFAQQDWPAVIRKTNLLLKRAPEAVSAAIYRMQGVALREEGDMQLAQDAFDTALALVSDREQRLSLLGDITGLLILRGQWNEVLRYTREALHLVPGDAHWLATQEQAQSKVQKTSPVAYESEGQGQDRIQQAPPTTEKTKKQWRSEGDAHFNAGRINEALAAYDKAIALDPNYAPVYASKSNALNDLDRYDEALTTAEEGIRLNPNYSHTYVSKGNALRALKRYDEALKAYDQAILLDPGYSSAYNHKGHTFHDLKRYDEALEAYEQAIRLNPRHFGAYTNKGSTLYTIKRYDEALEASEQAIRLNPNFPYSYYIKGSVLHKLKRYNEALEAYNQAIALYPEFADAYRGKGDTLKLLGRSKEAEQAYEKARQLGSSS